MKTIKKVCIPVLLLLFGYSQNYAQQTLETFDKISAIGDVEVILTQGETESIELEVEGMSKEDVSVEVEGGALKIRILKALLYKDVEATAYVTYTNLRAIRASAGARIECKSVVEGDQIEFRASSGSWINAEVKANVVETVSTEGGILRLNGSATSQNTTVSTGGQCECEEMETKRAYIKANTGGLARIFVTESLEANANTGGSVRYRGEPQKIETKELISGGVEKL
ncbi:MAG: DUF2807 domain-containing protein [Saprospiraceae bacterium]|nr:DUF2807 domain-containing protein [Saprospiraceae bacterium]